MKSCNVRNVLCLLVVLIEMVKASGTNPDDILLFGNRNGFILLSPNTSEVTHIESNPIKGMKVIFLDYHKKTNTVYFSSQNNHRISISKTQLIGSGQEDVLSLNDDTAAEGVAIDWIAQNLYWVTPREHKISVSRLDGSTPVDVVTGLGDPRDVCLDPANGYLYWSDWGENPAIERSFLDGTGREAIVTEDLGYPNGIAIDLVEGKLYWGDAYYNRIESCDLDGSNRKTIISDKRGHVFGLTLLGDNVYWSDWLTRRIEMANKHTGEDRQVLYDAGTRVMGLTAFDINKIPEGSNTCGANNGQCSHLCLYRPPPLTQICACPEGMELHPSTGGSGGICSQTQTSEDTTTPNPIIFNITQENPTVITTESSPIFNENDNATGLDFDDNMDTRHNETEGSLNRTFISSEVNTTDVDFNKTNYAGSTETTEVFSETDTGRNGTNRGFETTPTSFSTPDSDDRTEETTSGASTMFTTEKPSEPTEEPRRGCPCGLPQTADYAVDHFCLKDTTVVLKTTVYRAELNILHHELSVFHRTEELFKNDGGDLTPLKLNNLNTVLSTDFLCSCGRMIMPPAKDFLFMGKIEDGKMSASYVMSAQGPEYTKSVEAFRRKNTCVFHKWSKLQAQWAKFGGLNV